MLAGFAGLAAIAIAFAGVGLLKTTATAYVNRRFAGAPPVLPRLDEIAVEPTVLLFVVALALVAGLLFGLLPALRLSKYGERGHASELLPAIERLLDGASIQRDALSAIFVNRGPGGYAGLRVGISTAMALAFALDADLVSYGRLEADAYPFLAFGRPVCAIHDAGRGEYAWAVYQQQDESLTELQAPRIGPFVREEDQRVLTKTLAGACGTPPAGRLGAVEVGDHGARRLRLGLGGSATRRPRFLAHAEPPPGEVQADQIRQRHVGAAHEHRRLARYCAAGWARC